MWTLVDRSLPSPPLRRPHLFLNAHQNSPMLQGQRKGQWEERTWRKGRIGRVQQASAYVAGNATRG